MRLVWVTGISGAGKSTVCEVFKARGLSAIDTDWDGFNHWVDHVTHEPTVDPPARTPPDWLETHAWHIRPDLVRALGDDGDGVTFLFGAVANEIDVWDRFDRVGCLVLEEATLRHRLASRTTNAFGKHSTELEQILEWNRDQESLYRAIGATVIDGSRPLEEVVDAVFHLADGLWPEGQADELRRWTGSTPP